jgi:hypothetical protein
VAGYIFMVGARVKLVIFDLRQKFSFDQGFLSNNTKAFIWLQ